MDFGCNPEDPSATFGDTTLPSYRLDYFGELTGYDMFESKQAPWSLEEVGYAYDAPHFHPDGRVEGGLHPPEYYAYSPHAGSWQDGLQDIEDFDWPSEQYEHRLSKTQNDFDQCPGDVLAFDGVVSPLAPTSRESAVHTDQFPDQAKPHQPEANPGYHVQNLDSIFPAIESTPGPDASILAASYPPSTSPPLVPDSIPEQISECSVAHSHAYLDAQTDVVTSKAQNDRVSGETEFGCPSIVTESNGLQTSLGDKCDAAKQPLVDQNPEARVLQDEKSINGKATSGYDITSGSGNTTSAESQAFSTSPAEDTLSVLPSLETKSEQLFQEPLEAHSLNGNNISLDVPDCNPIEEDVTSTSSELDATARSQTKDCQEEEKLPEPAEPSQDPSPVGNICLPPQENARDTPHELDLGTGSSNAAALPGADLPKSSIGKGPNSPSPENLARVEDDVDAQWQTQLQDAADEVSNGVSGLVSPGTSRRDVDASKGPSMDVGNGSPAQERSTWPAQWLEQQCANSMTLPTLPFQPEEEMNEGQGSDTSALSDAPSSDTNATLGLTPDGLARKLTTVIQAEGADSNGSAIKGQGVPGTPVNAEVPTKTLRVRLKVNSKDLHKRSKPAKKTNSASDTDFDAPPKKRQRQGAYTGPSPQAPSNLSGQIIFGTKAELQQPDNDDGDTEENDDTEKHYSDIETTPPSQALVLTPSMKTLRSRPKVSNRELEGLTPTKYRERSSKARNQGTPIARQLFASQKKPDGLGTLIMSTKALEESAAVKKKEGTLILVEDRGIFEGTSRASTRPKAKPGSVATKAKRETGTKTPQATKKAPTGRTTRKRKVSEAEEEPEAFSPRKTSATKGTVRTTRRKGDVLGGAEKDEILVSTEEQFRADTIQDKIDSASEYADPPHTLETTSAPVSDADDESCDTPAVAPTKSKLKNKTLSLGVQSAGIPKQRNDTPAASTISSSGTPGANKYGFTSRRGPKVMQPRKAAGAGTSGLSGSRSMTSKAAASTTKTAARAKGKAADVASPRKTRRAFVREQELRQANGEDK